MRMLPTVLLASAAVLTAAAPAHAAVEVTPVAGTAGLTVRGLLAPDRHTVLFSDDCGAVREVARNAVTLVAGQPSCTSTPTLEPPSFGDAADPLGAQLSSVVGLGQGAAGEVLLADAGYHRVRSLTASGVTTLAGTGTQLADGGFADGAAGSARFDQPAGVERLPDGSVVVADSGNGRVRRIAGGSVGTLAGGGTVPAADGVLATDAHLGIVADVAVLPSGTVAFTETTAGKVWRIASDGTLHTVADGLSLPFGIDARGPELVVADLRAGRVVRVAADGRVSELTTAVALPYAVAVVPCTGDVLVAGFSATDTGIYQLRDSRRRGCGQPPGQAARP